MELNYKNSGSKKELTIKRTSKPSFKKFLFINSKPFAIITAIGSAAINNSDPFLLNVKMINAILIRRWIKSKIQFFLNPLLTERALPVFTNMAEIATIEIINKGTKNLFSSYKLKL